MAVIILEKLIVDGARSSLEIATIDQKHKIIGVHIHIFLRFFLIKNYTFIYGLANF